MAMESVSTWARYVVSATAMGGILVIQQLHLDTCNSQSTMHYLHFRDKNRIT
jgi:hypothetical protein